jgi:cell division transport system permease protein
VVLKIEKLIKNIISFSVLIGMGIFVVSYVFIANTIRITIYAKRENIEIMNLMGATPLFIKIPFVIEGLLQGLMGALLSLIILFGIKLQPKIILILTLITY